MDNLCSNTSCLEYLSKDMIYKICEYLHIMSICQFNLVNKNISRKVTYYMVNNLMYVYSDKMIVDMVLSEKYDKYYETHLKCIKKVKIHSRKHLKLFKDNLMEITFDNGFNEPINNVKQYFSNAKKIFFGYYFNQPIEQLDMPNLQEIYFGNRFDQPIQKINAPKLQKIFFGSSFSNSIEKLNCPNLQEIFFDETYNCSIGNLQFVNLKKIYVHYSYEYINNIKIQSLSELSVYHNKYQFENECRLKVNDLIKQYPNYKISMFKKKS